MFRKYYKDAVNDIKPSEDFVASVIENAKKRRPPLYARYTKHAAAIAAAVVIVSGAVLSMPLWQRVTDDTDGVIIEETVTENTAESAAPVPTAAPQSKTTAAPQIPQTKTPSKGNTDNSSYTATGESVSVTPQTTEAPAADLVSEAETQAAEADKGADAPAMPAPEPEAAEDYFVANAEITADTDNELYYAKAFGASGSAASRSEETATPAMPSVNTPSGYHTVYASGDYYEFENDSGDTVTVNLYWVGGADSAAVYGNDGSAYTAELKRNGYNITIYGSDKDAVMETVNLLN